MEVTLRKASSFSQSLLEAARSLPLSKTVTVSIYSTTFVADEVTAAQEKLLANVQKAIALSRAAFEIRTAIGNLNAASGIDALLTEKASLDSVEKLLNSLVSTTAHQFMDESDDTALSVAQARLDALRERQKVAETRFGSVQESISVSVLSDNVATQIQDQLTAIRRRKIAIGDELLVINMTKKIALTTETVALLTEFKII